MNLIFKYVSLRFFSCRSICYHPVGRCPWPTSGNTLRVNMVIRQDTDYELTLIDDTVSLPRIARTIVTSRVILHIRSFGAEGETSMMPISTLRFG